jgi:polyisoprenyl-phosphate glycosyltransferase
MSQPLISVVSPVFKGETLVPELVRRITAALSKHTDNFQIVLVDDGSPDKSWEMIELCAKSDARILGIKLSRNFGQHHAVIAGVNYASGETIAIIDCDLQDDPNDILLLLQQYREGYDIVFTKRVERKHSLIKIILSKAYNFLFKVFSDEYYDVDVGSLVLFSEKVRAEFIQLLDNDYVQMLKWLGYKTAYVPVMHHERYAGESSYTFRKLLSMGLQGWISHSTKMLRFIAFMGAVISITSFLAALFLILKFGGDSTHAYMFVIVTLLFSTGLILTSIGVVSLYVGKIFMQTKHRPLFVVEQFSSLNGVTSIVRTVE